MLSKLEDKNLKLKYILLTHAHFDHMLACEKLREETKAPLCVHEADADAVTEPRHSYLILAGILKGFKPADIRLKEVDVLTLGTGKFEVIHTPGHTKGSCCYTYSNDVFCGDTVFDSGYGRTDLYGGDERAMADSLDKIHRLFDGSGKRFHPGHGNSFVL